MTASSSSPSSSSSSSSDWKNRTPARYKKEVCYKDAERRKCIVSCKNKILTVCDKIRFFWKYNLTCFLDRCRFTENDLVVVEAAWFKLWENSKKLWKCSPVPTAFLALPNCMYQKRFTHINRERIIQLFLIGIKCSSRAKYYRNSLQRHFQRSGRHFITN